MPNLAGSLWESRPAARCVPPGPAGGAGAGHPRVTGGCGGHSLGHRGEGSAGGDPPMMSGPCPGEPFLAAEAPPARVRTVPVPWVAAGPAAPERARPHYPDLPGQPRCWSGGGLEVRTGSESAGERWVWSSPVSVAGKCPFKWVCLVIHPGLWGTGGTLGKNIGIRAQAENWISGGGDNFGVLVCFWVR